MVSSSKASDQNRPVDAEACSENTPLVNGKQEVLPFPLNYSPFMVQLNKHFGWKLMVMLFASQHLMKGFVGGFTGPATQYLLGSYKVEGAQMQIFSGVFMLPWAMKPVLGLISDCFPICGYNKGPYIAIFSVVGCLGCLALGKLPSEMLSVESAVLCLFLMNLQFATCDLLTEAKYAEKMQAQPEHGPDLMSYVWFALYGGVFIATLLVGTTMHHFGLKSVYLIALVPAAFILIPVLNNYLEEEKKSAAAVAEKRQQFFQQREASFLCILMFACTLLLTVLGIVYKDIYVNAAAALIVGLIMLVAFSVLLRPIIAKVNAFFLLQTSLSFSIGGAAFYFYTDTPEQYHAGPHFSMEFFTSVLGTMGSVCALFGIYTYQRYMREWKYTHLLLMTNLTLSALSALDVIFFARLNVKWGIPDHIFVMGASVFQVTINQWQWMPGVVILSQLCPSGMEATMYALLAGCHNLGNNIASSTGAVVLEWINCRPSGQKNEDEQFDNLWKGAILSTVLPMFTLVLLPYLIPDARQTDKLLSEEDRDATEGSLWRRWTGDEAKHAQPQISGIPEDVVAHS